MLLNNTNLIDALLYNRKKAMTETRLLEEVKAILGQNEIERSLIKETLANESSTTANKFEFDLLETDNIFHINQIKKVSIDYRLRFLDSNLFRNAIPEEAISKINALEKNHNTKLSGFKIMAPSKAFNLKKYDDPLLFAPIGNDYYYLIHKWGNDLAWYRKLQFLPIKNMVTFVITCLLLSLVFTYFTPPNPLSASVEFAPIIIFLFLFKSMVGTVGYYFFMMGKNFNDMIWDRAFKEN
ncbi:hypothetical protein [Flavobacterium sp.]|uniref:hypothetical protein n=1 Tax=Flavobacterium sp. TaxID=239 RepID=UPI0037534797